MTSMKSGKQICAAIALGASVIAACLSPGATARPRSDNPYRTDAWGNKFPYAGYSTYLSSYLLWREFPTLIALASDPRTPIDQLQRLIKAYRARYVGLTETEVRAALEFGRANRSLTIYEEERSAISTDPQNQAFMAGMKTHAELRPVDELIKDGKFQSDNLQMNVHRTLYNNAFLIPQNSMAGIINAYAVGIRSVELDALPTDDGVPVAIHDLVTNRLTGDFDAPPTYVGKSRFDQIEQTSFDVLNPMARTPAVQSTGVNRLMSIKRVLDIVTAAMPELTLYIDARNDAPIGLIRLLRDYPQYRDKVVIKVYPFAFPAGADGLIAAYADQYKLGRLQAQNEIAKINPNILLVLGSAASQATEKVGVGSLSTLSFEQWTNLSTVFPFVPGSKHSMNSFNGIPIFTDTELARIAGLSWIIARWGADFSAIANVMIYQVPVSVPSLTTIIRANDASAFNAMPVNARADAAVNDNFIALYHSIMAGGTQILIARGGAVPLHRLIGGTRFGFADRFPDFALALRTNGAINQASLKNFLYNMNGTVYTKCDYQTRRSHSAGVDMQKLAELKNNGVRVSYITTDLPTDLRAGLMGMFGKDGLPTEINYRMGGVVKQRYNPTHDLIRYRTPIWTTRLFGTIYATGGYFESDLRELGDLSKKMRDYANGIAILDMVAANPSVPIVNRLALEFLGQGRPVPAEQIVPKMLEVARATLNTQLQQLNIAFGHRKNALKDSYSIAFDGEAAPPDFDQLPVFTPTDPDACPRW